MSIYAQLLRNGTMAAHELNDERGDLWRSAMQTLPDAVCVRIDNVFDHLVRIGERGRDDLALNDLPAAIPPWPTMFAEWDYNCRSINGWTPWSNVLDGHAGWLVNTWPLEVPGIASALVDGWMFLYGVYDENPGIPHGPMMHLRFAVDESGRLIKGTMATEYYAELWPSLLREMIGKMVEQRSHSLVSWLTRGAWMPVAFAVGLMHCKNVSIEDRLPTRQQRRQAERKGEPLLRYRELVIDPNRQQSTTGGSEKPAGPSSKSLHIARGHFATYTEDKPLFGKYTGMFWRPAHVRGNADVGAVFKDYRVKETA